MISLFVVSIVLAILIMSFVSAICPGNGCPNGGTACSCEECRGGSRCPPPCRVGAWANTGETRCTAPSETGSFSAVEIQQKRTICPSGVGYQWVKQSCESGICYDGACRAEGYFEFNGIIDDVKIYTRGLVNTEIYDEACLWGSNCPTSIESKCYDGFDDDGDGKIDCDDSDCALNSQCLCGNDDSCSWFNRCLDLNDDGVPEGPSLPKDFCLPNNVEEPNYICRKNICGSECDSGEVTGNGFFCCDNLNDCAMEEICTYVEYACDPDTGKGCCDATNGLEPILNVDPGRSASDFALKCPAEDFGTCYGIPFPDTYEGVEGQPVCGNNMCEYNEYVSCPSGAACVWAGSCPQDCTAQEMQLIDDGDLMIALPPSQANQNYNELCCGDDRFEYPITSELISEPDGVVASYGKQTVCGTNPTDCVDENGELREFGYNVCYRTGVRITCGIESDWYLEEDLNCDVSCEACDFNGDGYINSDLNDILDYYCGKEGQRVCGTEDLPYDVNGDGLVDELDVTFCSQFGEICTVCGDGIKNGNEECDYSVDGTAIACPASSCQEKFTLTNNGCVENVCQCTYDVSCVPGNCGATQEYCDSLCGNGQVDPGETCLTCPEDSGCDDGTVCCGDGSCGTSGDPACPPAPCNNNGICERGESCNCPDCDGYQDSCANGLVCWDGGCTGNTCELINVTIGENIPEDTCVDEGDYISVNATYMGTCPDKVYVTVNTTNLYCPIGYE